MVKALLVAAVSSGQGKTTVTAALARKLVKLGQRVRVFKCGPDFIDPMLLERASGAPVLSLDLWMVGHELCRRQLAQAAAEADVILIEGVMGLYDGTPSSADLAREFGVPVMAVIDAGAMAQTAGALVHGLRDYGPVEMAGVIANRVASEGHAKMVAASLRDIPLFATLPKQAKSLPERHLGLVLPDEVQDIDQLLDELADQLSFDQAAWDSLRPVQIEPAPTPLKEPLLAGITIAIARDPAFMFLYPANLETLRAMGATLKFFSPLANQAVPAEADAVYLPGGYPELHAEQLSQSTQWTASIRAVHADGMPIVAECGGMMALADTLADKSGAQWNMAGLLPGAVAMQPRLAGLGSQGLETPQGILRGHTFHYSKLATEVAPAAYTIKHPSAIQGEAVYRVGSLTASYFHAYFASNPAASAALFLRSET
ncbi:cobyrinic acid a,c-diamide synthase [Duganella sp. CF402]|uniref:cobyrinate a,c-diamide synthase n=1 Tax=unclassified Duganella TaxID=2636909 RepID=UPI0008AF2B7C|nr:MULTISPECIES: cobyrinate a,c-diamide synthase [unclassified Duganella]RZT01256.1 hydrogenobyrinic acid a,c-diamide synthase (glutamine-hydrolysing) /cobyrinate a,c-diamide synthase [Duganella sp. BK701]SEN23100.1 cobyrinic acid a,c-diamide synthase [Duganella sp. CF402]